MNIKISHYLLCIALLFSINITANAEDSPISLLETTTNEIVSALNAERANLEKDPLVVNHLVEKILLPHIDIISASKWVLGKNWRRANKEQKIRFIKAFRELLVRFYSTALADYLKSNEVDRDMFRYFPIRGEIKEEVTVRSEIHSRSGKSIPVNYYMHQTRKGWKVYDVAVEGVSMITTYRNSFADEVKVKGVDGLIESLEAKNKNLAMNK